MTHPHFIRCIIPNEKKASGVIDASLVLNQLTCNGVLEGIRICRKGFPNRMLHADFRQRYSILAADEANSSPDSKKCAAAILAKVVKSGTLTEENFRVGETKVFFKAGILAHLEDVRDEILRTIMTKLQAFVRWYLGLIDRKRRTEQRAGLVVLQRNVRQWCTLRKWEWFKLYTKVRPMLRDGKIAEQIDKLKERIAELEEGIQKEQSMKNELDRTAKKNEKEKSDLMAQLEEISRKADELSAKADSESKGHAYGNIFELEQRLEEADERNGDLLRAKKKAEGEVESIRKQIQDVEMSARKAETERQSKDHQIRSVQDEMQQQEQVIAKLSKELKHQEEMNKKILEDLNCEGDKSNHVAKIKSKLEQTLAEMEDSLERECRAKSDTEKARRKVEGELKMGNETMDEITKQKHDLENSLKRKEAEMVNLSGRLDEEQSLVNRLQRQIKEAQSRLSELSDEREMEHEAKSKSDRIKSELQHELAELSERLDEQDGATASQIEMNKKREAELARLRHDIEEANLSHETQLHALKKKQTDAVAELGDQLEQITKQK
ncbi:unnamed protein product, partial [Anisakis simplex]|uniref:Myosin motor domain-containing protein n=1 Tax=Anisakis simplex TaxID=6269 RepID=A0A0M3KGH1_ANISI